MSKNKSLLLGFSVGAFIVLLVTSLVASLLINNNIQNAKAVESSIFDVNTTYNDTSFNYGDNKIKEPYPSTVFYATISDASGNLIEVTECNFSTGEENVLFASTSTTLTAGQQYTVKIYGPTFLNIKIQVGNSFTCANVDCFTFIYSEGLTITFSEISILDDSWFTDYNDATNS